MAENFPGANAEAERICAEVGVALDAGKLGDIVAKHEQLIRNYYVDVQDQARRSFDAAIFAAEIGFWVLIGTLVCALIIDVLSLYYKNPAMTKVSLTVGGVGLVSGFLIEFIAGVAFWIYAQGAKQFSAFHICLERTHRYLLAYKMVEKLESKRDDTLRDLICIMAKAPMITREDVDVSNSVKIPKRGARSEPRADLA